MAGLKWICPHCYEVVKDKRLIDLHRQRECKHYWEVLATVASYEEGLTLTQIQHHLKMCGVDIPRGRLLTVVRKLVAFDYLRSVQEDGYKVYFQQPGALIALALLPRVPKKWLTRREVLRCL